jgi:hypothetical protein
LSYDLCHFLSLQLELAIERPHLLDAVEGGGRDGGESGGGFGGLWHRGEGTKRQEYRKR